MIKIEILFKGTRYDDISKFYVPKSYNLQLRGINSDRKSVLSTCSFTLYYDKDIYINIIEATSPIKVRIYENRELVFDGQLDPVAEASWTNPKYIKNITLECVDFSADLDKKTAWSASYPDVVDGPSFWIFKRDNPKMSLLYLILQQAGLEDRIDKTAPDIPVLIRHMSWTKGDLTYRNLLDSLLSEYLWAINVDIDKLTWAPIARATLPRLDEIEYKDLIGEVSINKSYSINDGIIVKWSKVKVMNNALLWRGNLPIGDTANPRPGEDIAGGDCWPEDSDITETWQNFGTEYLDTKYLSGENRLKNDEITLISSSDWVLSDSKDDKVIIDPIDENNTIKFEALRARLRYKNTATTAKKLYSSEIHGKALYQSALMTSRYPESASDSKEISASYIYEADYADRLCAGRYMILTKGCFDIKFISTKKLKIAGFYKLKNNPLIDDESYIQIISASKSEGNEITYTAYTTAPYTDIKPNTSGQTSSGRAAPGQDGSSPRLAYIRNHIQPTTPVGPEPEGWTISRIPDGYAPVWMSSASFTSTGQLDGLWTEPVRLQGIDAGSYLGAIQSIPSKPIDRDYFLYTGSTTANFTQYHIYEYKATDEIWVETQESDRVMGVQKDALQIAKNTGAVIYAALLFVELLVTRKLMVGGGSLVEGLLVRFLDEDENGNCIIEARYNGNKIWWIDVDTGKMYGNFTEVVQYLPFTFADQLDSSHPAYFDFYIPESTVEIVKVSIRGRNYRGYSSALSSWGNVETSTNKSFFWNNFSLNETQTNKTINFSHAHNYYKVSNNTSYAEDHTHNLRTNYSTGQIIGIDNAGRHSHSINSSNDRTSQENFFETIPIYKYSLQGNGEHTHTVDIRHSHDIEYGITEKTKPTNMTLSFSEGLTENFKNQVSVTSGGEYILDIATSGWKSIKITSSTLGRVQVQVMVRIKIDTTLS